MAQLIANLTNFATQVTQLQLPDGTTATMTLVYQGAAERWAMDIAYGDITINGINLCTLPNVLAQWENLLPFGLSCVTADLTDPFDINDFATGRALLYLLDSADLATIKSDVFGATA